MAEMAEIPGEEVMTSALTPGENCTGLLQFRLTKAAVTFSLIKNVIKQHFFFFLGKGVETGTPGGRWMETEHGKVLIL